MTIKDIYTMGLNRPRTEEEKRHQSEVMRGRTTPPEVRAKISASMKKYNENNPGSMNSRIVGLKEYHKRAQELIKKYGMNDEN